MFDTGGVGGVTSTCEVPDLPEVYSKRNVDDGQLLHIGSKAYYDGVEEASAPMSTHFAQNAKHVQTGNPLAHNHALISDLVNKQKRCASDIISTGKVCSDADTQRTASIASLADHLHPPVEGAGGAERVITKQQFITDFKDRCVNIDAAVARVKHQYDTQKYLAQRNGTFVSVNEKSRPLGSYFNSWDHFIEATRNMNHVHVPDFMAQHMEPRVAESSVSIVQVKPANSRSTGYVEHEGHMCIYRSSARNGAAVEKPRAGDYEAVLVRGRRGKEDWAGVNVQEVAEEAARVSETPRKVLPPMDPISICQMVVNQAANSTMNSTTNRGEETRSVANRNEWRNIGAPRLHRGQGDADFLDEVLYEGRPVHTTGTARTMSTNDAHVAYSKKVLEHFRKIGAHATFRHGGTTTQTQTHIQQTFGGTYPGLTTEAGRQRDRQDFKDLTAGGVSDVETDYDNLRKFATVVTKTVLKSLMANKSRVPFDILLLRPFMTYSMSSAILMKCGWETGATFVGHSDFILGDDVVSKLHYGNFTFYSKAVVTNPKNIIIAENIFSQGYIRGNGVEFFKVDPQCPTTKTPTGYKPQSGEHEADFISVLIPYGSGDKLPNPLDIEGHQLYDSSKTSSKLQKHEPGMAKASAYMDADFVSEVFRLHEFSKDRADPANDPFINYEATQNTICFRGHSFHYDPTTCQHTAVTINTGHWGKDVYPGT